MRQTVYKCDQCTKEIGEKKHISIQFAEYSGIAVPPSGYRPVKNFEKKDESFLVQGYGSWTIQNSLRGRFMHFCNAVCLQRFFSSLMAKAK